MRPELPLKRTRSLYYVPDMALTLHIDDAYLSKCYNSPKLWSSRLNTALRDVLEASVLVPWQGILGLEELSLHMHDSLVGLDVRRQRRHGTSSRALPSSVTTQ